MKYDFNDDVILGLINQCSTTNIIGAVEIILEKYYLKIILNSVHLTKYTMIHGKCLIVDKLNSHKLGYICDDVMYVLSQLELSVEERNLILDRNSTFALGDISFYDCVDDKHIKDLAHFNPYCWLNVGIINIDTLTSYFKSCHRTVESDALVMEYLSDDKYTEMLINAINTNQLMVTLYLNENVKEKIDITSNKLADVIINPYKFTPQDIYDTLITYPWSYIFDLLSMLPIGVADKVIKLNTNAFVEMFDDMRYLNIYFRMSYSMLSVIKISGNVHKKIYGYISKLQHRDVSLLRDIYNEFLLKYHMKDIYDNDDDMQIKDSVFNELVDSDRFAHLIGENLSDEQNDILLDRLVKSLK